jgi:hypothetical protein
MKNGVLIALAILLVGGLAVGGELLYLRHRNAEDAAPTKADTYKSDPDDLVFLKQEHPMTMQDEKDLKGRTLWVSAGGQMDYYPYAGKKIAWDKTEGVLLGAEKIVVDDAITAPIPKKNAIRIPPGDKQVILIISKPDDPARKGKQYALPVGYIQGGDFNVMTDQIFFYDDPHQLYKYWGPEIWTAIDQHRAIVGMTEREVQMALGQISDPHGDKPGDRDVIYDDQGHPKRVTFENGKARRIADAS